MTCRRARGLLSAYLDDRLPSRAAADLDRHLQHCTECRAALSSLRSATRLLAGFRAPRLEVDLAPGVVARASAPSQREQWRAARASALFRPAFIMRQVARAVALAAICVLAASGSRQHCRSLILSWPGRVAAIAHSGAAHVAAGLAELKQMGEGRKRERNGRNGGGGAERDRTGTGNASLCGTGSSATGRTVRCCSQRAPHLAPAVRDGDASPVSVPGRRNLT